MRDLSKFGKEQIVVARMAGASVTNTAELLGVSSRATISRTMTEYKKHGKTPSNRCNSGQTSKLNNRDRRALRRIVGRKHQAFFFTTEFKKNRKPSSNRSKSGRTSILTDRVRSTAKNIVRRKHRTIVVKVTAELNQQHINSQVSTKNCSP